MSNEVAMQRQQDPLRTALYSPSVKGRFDEMLGKRAPGFMSSILSAVNNNPQLKQCEPMSVVSSAAIAASMELPINSSLGLAHIVPYRTKNGYVAQFQIGWKGFVQLALRSGQYKTIHLTPVLEGQIKEMNQFTGEIEFQKEAISDKQVGYLLYFRLLNGYEKFFYMTTEQLQHHAKKYSKTFQKGYGVWSDDFEAMALKTVCKLGLSKYGVLSLEMQKAIESDQAELNPHGEIKYPDNQPGVTAVEVDARRAIDEKFAAQVEEPTIDISKDDFDSPFNKEKK